MTGAITKKVKKIDNPNSTWLGGISGVANARRTKDRTIMIRVNAVMLTSDIVGGVAGGNGRANRGKVRLFSEGLPSSELAEAVTVCSAPIGASFTFLALVTGSLWGKPMWGTYWVWDARLTSELILLFLYLGIIGLYGAIEDKRNAGRAISILALVGVINLPIIHYSVEWWSTLHQPATITKFDKPSIHVSMLIPLLMMALAFKLMFGAMLMTRIRAHTLDTERRSAWVREEVLR